MTRKRWTLKEWLQIVLPLQLLGAKKKYADRAAREVPTEPGYYRDREGDRWFLNSQGQWFDHTGQTRPTKYNYMLVYGAPYTKE